MGCSHNPKSTETIDREAVRAAVRKSLSSIKSCYEPEYKKDKSLEGQVTVAWEIQEGGVAKNVHIVPEKTSLKNQIVQQCIVLNLSQIKFPEPPKGTVAEISGYPFMFSTKKSSNF